MREGLKLREGLVLETRWPGWTRFIRRIIDRAKVSRQGREAHEVLEIDRTDPHKTTKYHRVDELVDGQWKTVHDHREEVDAKRRPLQQGTSHKAGDDSPLQSSSCDR